MGSKFKRALKKSKFVWVIVLAMLIMFSIAFVPPMTVTIVDSENVNDFMDNFLVNFTELGENIKLCFTEDYIGSYLKGELYLTIVLVFITIYGVCKSLPKNEYTDIEHGSSDWAKGEQYEVLSNKKGIILAEKHYLPVDKRGNVNVLVVGRIRFW